MTAKHSPAPFVAHRDKSPARIVAADGDCIALVYLTEKNSKKRDEAHLANVHLFATAPELLAVLKELLDNRGSDYLHVDDQEMIRAALKGTSNDE